MGGLTVIIMQDYLKNKQNLKNQYGLKKEDKFGNEDNLKNEVDFKNDDDLKNENEIKIDENKDNSKNSGHDMAIVGEPCNADAPAKIPALFIPMLCVHMYCTTVHTDCDCTVVSLTYQSINPIQGTPHTLQTPHIHRQTQMLRSGSPIKNQKIEPEKVQV